MATTLTQTHPLLTVPFSAATDFTTLSEHCEHFADTLIESDDPTLKIALCGRLATCLTLLRSTLNDPVPQHIKESLTVESLPVMPPHFEPDSEQLCDYCVALSQLLMAQAMPSEAERTLTELLAELVWFFAAELNAPRWVRTENSIKAIGESGA